MNPFVEIWAVLIGKDPRDYNEELQLAKQKKKNQVQEISKEEQCFTYMGKTVVFCRKCGAQLPADSIFCGSCGEKIVSVHSIERTNSVPLVKPKKRIAITITVLGLLLVSLFIVFININTCDTCGKRFWGKGYRDIVNVGYGNAYLCEDCAGNYYGADMEYFKNR